MQLPFKYQFPLKHITLNQLPKELFPQPMRRNNYDLKEITTVRKDQNIFSNYYSCNLGDNDIKQKIVKNISPDTINLYNCASIRYLSHGKLNKRIENQQKNNKVSRSSISAHIQSKTEKVFKMQTESSLEARNIIFQGNSFSINLYDDQTIITSKKELGVIQNNNKILPPSLNESTIKYENETSTFQKIKENVRDKLRSRLFRYYHGALSGKNQENKEYLLQQISKYREYESPQKEINNDKLAIIASNRKTKILPNRRSYITDLRDSTTIDLQPTKQIESKKYRAISEYQGQENQLLTKARIMKTDQHHILIKKITAKTGTLFQQWNTFQIQEDQFKNGALIKDKQMKILGQNKTLNHDNQIKLKKDLCSILKMMQNTDNNS